MSRSSFSHLGASSPYTLFGPPVKNNAFRIHFTDFIYRKCIWMHLTVYAAFTHSSCNKLIILSPKSRTIIISASIQFLSCLFMALETNFKTILMMLYYIIRNIFSTVNFQTIFSSIASTIFFLYSLHQRFNFLHHFRLQPSRLWKFRKNSACNN